MYKSKWDVVREISPQGGNSVEDKGRGQNTVVSVIEDCGNDRPGFIVQKGDAVSQAIEKTKEHQEHD